MIRAAVLVGFLALAATACGSKQSSGPAWPKSAGKIEVDPEKDGGESLEPQQAVSVAAIEHSDDKTPAVDDDAIVMEASPGDVKMDVIEVKPAPAPDDAPTEP